jgi:cobalt/nickel transport system permease protein
MRLGLDDYAYLDSPLHRWEPRYKLIGLASLILAFSFVQHLGLLPVMLLITGGLYWLSRLPMRFLLSRLKLPGFFLLGIAVLLPFLAGETILLRLGPLAVRQEGVLALVLIATRFLCILTVGVILFGTGPFIRNIRAMRALGLPSLLADMILLSYRYIYEIADYLSTMRKAMRLRGFQAKRFSLRNMKMLASLIGSLLIRSYEQSDQVYKAMVLRGYGQSQMVRPERPGQRWDAIALALACTTAVSIIVVNISL